MGARIYWVAQQRLAAHYVCEALALMVRRETHRRELFFEVFEREVSAFFEGQCSVIAAETARCSEQSVVATKRNPPSSCRTLLQTVPSEGHAATC